MLSPSLPDLADLAMGDDGIVSERAELCMEQSARWLRIAAQCARTIGKERGYRLAVSRAGVWALRARREYRSEVTRSQRIRLARWDVEATRYDAASWYGETGCMLVNDYAAAK